MNGILWIIFGASIGLMAPCLYLLWRRRAHEAVDLPSTRAPTPNGGQGQTGPSGGLKRKVALKFHGVSLKPGLYACAPVQAMAGQRFLPAEAPKLPLSACDQQKCECAYAHHADRRAQGDRRSGWGNFGGFTPTVPGSHSDRRGECTDRRSRS